LKRSAEQNWHVVTEVGQSKTCSEEMKYGSFSLWDGE